MASLESLIPLIYHEKQQPGSMLCAQHALNSLLQGNYFTAPDLSDIARNLDTLEETYRTDNRGRESMNMDDTGFFSVQVLENALQVWGLSLVRWRSEAMRPYQDHPHTQLAFILNLEQHWFTLRRFGRVGRDPSLDADPGDGHWFNLNSSLPQPERIGKLHLGMVLQQAEAEGYSVFAVVQTDPLAPLALPRTEVDELAASIPEPSTFQSASASTRPPAELPSGSHTIEGFEDEDMELQAALQASLAGPEQHFLPGGVLGPTATSAATAPATASRGSASVPPPVIPTHHGYGLLGREDEDEDEDEEDSEPAAVVPPQPVDPVQASIARNRAIMERMRREQEAALRSSYDEEVQRFESAWQRRTATGAGARSQSAHANEEVEDEDEMLRRAIAESEAMARGVNANPGQTAVDEDEDEEMDEYRPTSRAMPPLASSATHRVYDDDDAELQAALRASLESMPEGFRIPSPPPVRLPTRDQLPQQPQPVAPLERLQVSPPASGGLPPPTDDADEESETGSYITAESSPVVEQLSMEEIRRRRLARFGG